MVYTMQDYLEPLLNLAVNL